MTCDTCKVYIGDCVDPPFAVTTKQRERGGKNQRQFMAAHRKAGKQGTSLPWRPWFYPSSPSKWYAFLLPSPYKPNNPLSIGYRLHRTGIIQILFSRIRDREPRFLPFWEKEGRNLLISTVVLSTCFVCCFQKKILSFFSCTSSSAVQHSGTRLKVLVLIAPGVSLEFFFSD